MWPAGCQECNPAQSNSRYCPACGRMRQMRCASPNCAADDVAVGVDAHCRICGTIYRYHGETGEPHAVGFLDHADPGTLLNAGKSELFDLYASDADPLAARTKAFPRPAASPFSSTTARLSTAVSRCTARHGSLYTFAANGSLLKLDCRTLQPGKTGNHGNLAQPVPARDLPRLAPRVSEALVYLLWRDGIYCFEAATTRLLCRIACDDLRYPDAMIAGERLVVIGEHTLSNNEVVRVYELAACLRQPDALQPVLERKDPLQPSRPPLIPTRRITCDSERFYLLLAGGNLLSVPFDGGAPSLLFENTGNHAIHSWVVGPRFGCLFTAQGNASRKCHVAIFSPRGEEDARHVPLYRIQLHPTLDFSLICDETPYVLDADGCLHRLVLEDNTAYSESKVALRRTEGAVLQSLRYLPLPQQRDAVLAHMQEPISQRFALLRLYSGEISDLKLRPLKDVEISYAFCDSLLYLVNQREGIIEPFDVR